MAEKEVLLLAGGKGLRAGGGLPKQFHKICGRPLLWWSLRAFYNYDPKVRVTIVLHPDYVELWHKLVAELPENERYPHKLATGGEERGNSVKNGLDSLGIPEGKEKSTLVAIHDGARPLVTPEMISRGFDMAETRATAVAALPLTDSIRRLETPGNLESVSEPADRSQYVIIQTPQIFRYDLLKEAYLKYGHIALTDDAQMVEKLPGVNISLYAGDSANIKVTHPADFITAENILAWSSAD